MASYKGKKTDNYNIRNVLLFHACFNTNFIRHSKIHTRKPQKNYKNY